MKRKFMTLCVLGMTALLATGQAKAASCNLSDDAKSGEKVAGSCKACHTLEADAKPRPTGPNLHDVFGRKAAAESGFTRYSKAMTAAAEKGLVWNGTELDEYLADPKAFLTKTNGATLQHGMFFQVRKPEDRAAVVAYLKGIKDNPECP